MVAMEDAASDAMTHLCHGLDAALGKTAQLMNQ